MDRSLLSSDQLAASLSSAPGWTVVDGKLSRTYAFPSYMEGVEFAVGLANVADHMDHHPDLTIGYCRVTVAVNTHDAGGITGVDFELARRIDAIAQ